MAERQQALLDAIMKDPAVASVGSADRRRRRQHHAQQRPRLHRAQAHKPARAAPTRSSRGCGPTSPRSRASRSICRPRRTSPSAARLSKTQYQYTLNDADPGELNHWAALFLDKIKTVPGITDVATDQPNAGPLLDITINREVASSYGILPSTIDNTLDDAFGQRIVSTMYTTLNQYHVVLEVDPKFQYWPEALNGIYVKSSSRPAGAAIDAGRQRGQGRAARGQPPGPVPVGDDLVQPAAGHRDRRSGQRHPADRKGARQAALAADQLPGQRAGLRSRRCRARRS